MSNIETFQLVKERCLLAHVNVRSEMHGDEKKTAYDLKFVLATNNGILLKFHPELRDMFYKAGDTVDMINPEFAPVLRHPQIGPVSWELEIPRTLLRVHDEEFGMDVVLGGGKTNKFKFEMLEGGTVRVNFRCQFGEADTEQIARLLCMIDKTLPISLDCTEEEDEGDNFERAETITREPMSAAREEAEGLFLASSAPTVTDVTDAEETPSNVEPIEKKRRGRAAGGASIE